MWGCGLRDAEDSINFLMARHSSTQGPRNVRGAFALIRELEEENARLRDELEFLRGHPTIAKGLRGESLIARLVSARRSKRGAGHDLELSESELCFEVKYSSLLSTIAGRPIRRWVWTKIFGELGRKQYHRLLLIGDADPRFSAFYADPTSPYVIFDLSYEAAINIAGGIKPGRSGAIQLTTNPLTVKSPRALALFREYQVSPSEFKHRYASIETI